MLYFKWIFFTGALLLVYHFSLAGAQCEVDIVYLVDSSNSISQSDFSEIQTALLSLSGLFQSIGDQLQVAILQYGDANNRSPNYASADRFHYRQSLFLGECSNMACYEQKVENMTHMQASATYTALAIERAVKLDFTNSANNATSKKYIFLITDGAATDYDKLTRSYQLTESNNITVYAVGVGGSPVSSQLRQSANGNNNNDRVFIVASFSNLQNTLSNLTYNITSSHQCIISEMQIATSFPSSTTGFQTESSTLQPIEATTFQPTHSTVQLTQTSTTSSQIVCGDSNLNATVGRLGSLQSPNYPNDYPPNSECWWTITAPHGYRILINFTTFDLESCCDYLRLYDAPSRAEATHSNTALDSATVSSSPILSNFSYITMKFESDHDTEYKGFRLTFIASSGNENSTLPPTPTSGQTTDTFNHTTPTVVVCGDSNLNATVGRLGSLQSPNYPNNYPSYSECWWTITAPHGYRILINFTTFELESGYDHLWLYDAPSRAEATHSNTSLDSATVSSSPILSNFRYITMKFESDGSLQRKGFRLTFIASSGQVPPPYTPRPDVTTPHPTSSYSTSYTPPYPTGGPTGGPPTGGCSGAYRESLRRWNEMMDRYMHELEDWKRMDSCN